jgi:protein-disulfide reductase (glutathione)
VNNRKPVLATMIALICTGLIAQAAAAAGNWNDEKIGWRPYAEGMAAAKAEQKPICLIFYTNWCSHCTNYSKVFHDPRIVERSKGFVMIRVNKDKNAQINKKYAPDGDYIPRTYFLSAQGKLDPEIHAPRPNYQFFYDEMDPADVLAGMDSALGKSRSSN